VPDENDSPVPEPTGHLGKVPYDFRRPSRAKFKSRLYNEDDPRFFTPRAFGAGWGVNWHWVRHPRTYRRQKKERQGT
jgi:uncharacterized protein DUF5808